MTRTNRVTITIATTMLPVNRSKKTSVMNSAWNTGVKSQAISENGSPGWAGASGTAFGLTVALGVAVGAAEAAADPTAAEGDSAPSGAQAATTRISPTRISAGTSQRRTCEPRDGDPDADPRLSDRVIPTRVPGMAAGDTPDAQPASLEQPVLRDRLLGVARAGRFEAAARGQPEEDDSIESDQADAQRSHAVVGPPRTPPRWRSRPSASAISS